MSTPPSQNEGQTAKEDIFRHGLNPNLIFPHLQQQFQQQHLPPQQALRSTNSNTPLQHQTAIIQQRTSLSNVPISITSATQNHTAASALPAPTQFLHWSNPIIGNAPFLPTHPQPTSTTAPQQFNDFFFNIQAQAAYAAAAAVPGRQVPATTTQQETYSVLNVGNGNFLKIYHCPENGIGSLPGDTSFAHMSQYNQGQSPNFLPLNSQGNSTIRNPIQQRQSQCQLHGSNSTANSQVFNSYELFSSNTFTQLPTAEMPPLLLLGPTSKSATIRSTENINQIEPAASTDTTNVMVHNSNNKSNVTWTGGNHTQFENCQENEENFVASTHSHTNQEANSCSNIVPNVHMQQLQQQQQPILKENASLSKDSIDQTQTTLASAAGLVTITNLKTEIPRQEVPKKRIVAEVKPMRMTYSDVLSKLNNQVENHQKTYGSKSSMNTTTGSPNTPIIACQRSQQKIKFDSSNANNSSSCLRRVTDDGTLTRISSKKSPTHENKENQQQQQIISSKMNIISKRSTATVTNNNIGLTLNKPATTQKNSTINTKNSTFNINNNLNGSDNNNNQQSKKQRSNKKSDTASNGAKYSSGTDQRGLHKSNINNSTSGTTASTNNTYGRKPTKSSSSNNASSGTGQQRSRYQNNSNASYSYSSTKRGRNNSSFGILSSLNNSSYTHSARSTRNYELTKLVLKAWYTYTLKILAWLLNLVYDIVVLGCSILYERLIYAYESSQTYVMQLHKYLKQNSNKPGIWVRDYCQQFDAKFSKPSKWAFWRKFLKKKPPESLSESIKTGKLPVTGEEAMYQLLNCKGKDAYSILRVPPNSSQEQIRKHYKKIAVLVHPDKNKQAGAEEAFKVLQRAFELIGEPENRLAYDQSLAEALHAEKAWTELHDLLSQLQTKITEAANTIRCSTCGLRHPRKITDRAPYAARECSSCKIRHSSREGDIWAETTMLGFRWKYLALMEGKVYDITEWANCQKGALAHLEPNSHMVQYRIVRGTQQHQHQQKQHTQQQQQNHNQQHTGSQYSGAGVAGKFKRDNIPASEPSLHEFLDNLYSGQHPQQQQQNTSVYAGSSRRRNRRN